MIPLKKKIHTQTLTRTQTRTHTHTITREKRYLYQTSRKVT
uniref:Uncharacterized protein n=1 Tax=Anguilla anguilla TaxID=7936 RepID=A0A0E9WKZ2_ANGAN